MAASFATIKLDAQAMDCAFHPRELLLSIGLIDGTLETYSLCHEQAGEDEAFVSAKSGWNSDLHEDSCRCVAYLASGEAVVSASKDGSLVASDARTGEEAFRSNDAHGGSELSRLFCAGDDWVASGDEDGVIKMWDVRQKKEIAQFHEQEDYISDFAYHERDKCLVSTSGDGTVAIFDLHKSKLRARSEADADDEYLSCKITKNGKKIVVGTQDGVVSLFSWGYFNDCSDRFPGHPNSIDAIIKYDEDTILTGAGDGTIRILSILPNKLLGVLGVHQEDEPLERMAMSHDKLLLSSTSHDKVLKIWSLACLQEDSASDAEVEVQEPETDKDDGDDDDDDDDDDDAPTKKRRRKDKQSTTMSKKVNMKSKQSNAPNANDFFSGLL